MPNTAEKNYKFRGGLRIGLMADSWPNGILKFNENILIIRDEMIKMEISFTKEDIIKIVIKKHLPIIGYGIEINHKNSKYEKIYFWYVGFYFEKLTDALKECGWFN